MRSRPGSSRRACTTRRSEPVPRPPVRAITSGLSEQLDGGGFPASEAAELVAFLLGPGAAGITGRLISAQWDPWREDEFRERLRSDSDLAKLRRIDEQFFIRRS